MPLARLNTRRYAVWLIGLVIWLANPSRAEERPAFAGGTQRTSLSGPTLRLAEDQRSGNPVADFMYFVALISLEPVSLVQSPGNSQKAHLISATRRITGSSFAVTCEFEFAGQGYQRNIFDHSQKIHQQERKLQEGGVLDHQLGSINVEGSGTVAIEVEGTRTNGVPRVSQVRVRFNGRGRESPVTIDLHDIRYVDGAIHACNQTRAIVNTLTFRRQAGPPKMEISVGSIRPQGASDGAWERLLGKVKATAVNLVLDPIAIETVGQDTMLRFGLALASQEPFFTFPRARNLK
jgi:hypothetical protein